MSRPHGQMERAVALVHADGVRALLRRSRPSRDSRRRRFRCAGARTRSPARRARPARRPRTPSYETPRAPGTTADTVSGRPGQTTTCEGIVRWPVSFGGVISTVAEVAHVAPFATDQPSEYDALLGGLEHDRRRARIGEEIRGAARDGVAQRGPGGVEERHSGIAVEPARILSRVREDVDGTAVADTGVASLLRRLEAGARARGDRCRRGADGDTDRGRALRRRRGRRRRLRGSRLRAAAARGRDEGNGQQEQDGGAAND